MCELCASHSQVGRGVKATKEEETRESRLKDMVSETTHVKLMEQHNSDQKQDARFETRAETLLGKILKAGLSKQNNSRIVDDLRW